MLFSSFLNHGCHSLVSILLLFSSPQLHSVQAVSHVLCICTSSLQCSLQMCIITLMFYQTCIITLMFYADVHHYFNVLCICASLL